MFQYPLSLQIQFEAEQEAGRLRNLQLIGLTDYHQHWRICLGAYIVIYTISEVKDITPSVPALTPISGSDEDSSDRHCKHNQTANVFVTVIT